MICSIWCCEICGDCCYLIKEAACCECSICVNEKGECRCCAADEEENKGFCENQCKCDKDCLGVKLPLCICPHTIEGKEDVQCQIGCQGGECLLLPCPTCITPTCDTSSELYCDVTINNLYTDTKFADKCFCRYDNDDDESSIDFEETHCCCWTFGEGFLEGAVKCAWCRWSRKTRQYEFQCRPLLALWDPECYGRQNCCLFSCCQIIHLSVNCLKSIWSFIIFLFSHTVAFFLGFFISLAHCFYCIFVSCGLCLVWKCDHEKFCEDCACLCLVCKKLDKNQMVIRKIKNLADTSTRQCSCLCWHGRCVTEEYHWCRCDQEDKTPVSISKQPIISQPSSIQSGINDYEQIFRINKRLDSDESSVENLSDLEDPYINFRRGPGSESDPNLIDVLEGKKNDQVVPLTDVLFYHGSSRAMGCMSQKSLTSSDPETSGFRSSSVSDSLHGHSKSHGSNDVVIEEFDRSPVIKTRKCINAPMYVNEATNEQENIGSTLYISEGIDSPNHCSEKNQSRDKKMKFRKYYDRQNAGSEAYYENVDRTKPKVSQRPRLQTPNTRRVEEWLDKSARAKENFSTDSSVEDDIEEKYPRKKLHKRFEVENGIAISPGRDREQLKQLGRKTVHFKETVLDSDGQIKATGYAPSSHLQRKNKEVIYSQPVSDLQFPRPGKIVWNSEPSDLTISEHFYYNPNYLKSPKNRHVDTSDEDEIYSVPYSGRRPRMDWHQRGRIQKMEKQFQRVKKDLRLDLSMLSDNNDEPEKDSTFTRDNSETLIVDETLTVKRTVSERMKKLRAKKSNALAENTDSSESGQDIELQNLYGTQPTYYNVEENRQRKDKKDIQTSVGNQKDPIYNNLPGFLETNEEKPEEGDYMEHSYCSVAEPEMDEKKPAKSVAKQSKSNDLEPDYVNMQTSEKETKQKRAQKDPEITNEGSTFLKASPFLETEMDVDATVVSNKRQSLEYKSSLNRSTELESLGETAANDTTTRTLNAYKRQLRRQSKKHSGIKADTISVIKLESYQKRKRKRSKNMTDVEQRTDLDKPDSRQANSKTFNETAL